MRYPLWAFFFVLIMPAFTAHALLTGKAELLPGEYSQATRSSTKASTYWTHHVVTQAELLRHIDLSQTFVPKSGLASVV